MGFLLGIVGFLLGALSLLVMVILFVGVFYYGIWYPVKNIFQAFTRHKQ